MRTILRLATLPLLFSLFGQPAHAQQGWQLQKLDPSAFPPEIVEETRKIAPSGLPDGLIEVSGGNVAQAWYANPTERYRHGILGDAIEAGSLVAKMRNGRTYRLTLPKSEVFEDRYPRIADLDGDGSDEIITIRSSLTEGASVTIYKVSDGGIVQVATTGFIGRKNRWLNIAAIAPFLGIKGGEVAFVVTPHIGGKLFVMRYSPRGLVQVGAGEDFSNHAIGSREMRLSAIADVNGDGRVEVALPSADRMALRIVGTAAGRAGLVQDNRGNTIVIKPGDLVQGGLREYARVDLPAAIDKAVGVQVKGRKGFVVGLENGEVYLIHP